MFPATHTQRCLITRPSFSAPLAHHDTTQILLAIQHLGNPLCLSRSQAEQAIQKLNPDARLLINKALRAMSGDEPAMNLTSDISGGTFNFYESLINGSGVTYTHDGQRVTGITVHNSQGEGLAGIYMPDRGEMAIMSENGATGGHQPANVVPSEPVTKHDAPLPLLININGMHFKVGALKKKIDHDQRSQFMQAISAEPKHIVSYSEGKQMIWLSFSAIINQRKSLITLKADAQENLLGMAEADVGSGVQTLLLEFNPVSHIMGQIRQAIVSKSQSDMLAHGSAWMEGGLEYSDEDPVKTSFRELSDNNLARIREQLGKPEQYEMAFIQKLLSQPFFAVHITPHESAIDRADGSVSLFSRAKLRERNIPFNQQHTMDDDITLVAGEDQVYFSLECGSWPQKNASRFGDRLLRFNLNHPVFRELAILTLTDPMSRALPEAQGRFNTLEQYRTQADHQNEVDYDATMHSLKYRSYDPFKTVFHGKQMLEGVALHILQTLRRAVTPELAMKMLEQEQINTLVNGLFRPQIMVPRHFFGWPDDQAMVRYNPHSLGE